MSSHPAGIVVIGSINMDLVATTPTIPSPGQTILGKHFTTIPGGKGANQAVSIAKLDAPVALVGRLGDDPFGHQLHTQLLHSGVNCDHVQRTPGCPTGVALITVADTGENAITVVGGANLHLTPSDIDDAEQLIAQARCCVLQLEIPLETAIHTVHLARRHGVTTILDPAPAPAELPDELFAVDILTPNESEAATLLHQPATTPPATVAAALHARGARAVVLKLGSRGCYAHDDAGTHVPGHPIDVVDTTAAGDAFTGALATACAAGDPLEQAARFANAAGALACTRFGAQPSAPTRAEVQQLLDRSG